MSKYYLSKRLKRLKFGWKTGKNYRVYLAYGCKIDHSAVVVKDAAASFPLYRDRLDLKLMLEAENYDTEYEHI